MQRWVFRYLDLDIFVDNDSYFSGLDFLRLTVENNENDAANSSVAEDGNSLCFDPHYVQSLCNLQSINLVKTVR